MPKATEQSTLEWIEKMYGRISIHKITLYTATVPVMNGMAQGEGLSHEDAIESLYKDLTAIENPAIDREPEPAR